ncbi:hypothetical protein FGO68_gene1174 [Halteria grandinella]|uniref:TRP C-terminal domain-containing protein n=1 Tax=Halteria grandinella TaxID=5974 RepID=A0A8J8T919_HALGN|nr:hypothetical protein FGO68_gene1174 [Halteria grandinella]
MKPHDQASNYWEQHKIYSNCNQLEIHKKYVQNQKKHNACSFMPILIIALALLVQTINCQVYSNFPIVYGDQNLQTADYNIVDVIVNGYDEFITLATQISNDLPPQKFLSLLLLDSSGAPRWRYSLDLLATPSIYIVPTNMLETPRGLLFWNLGPSAVTQFLNYEYSHSALSQVVTTSTSASSGQFLYLFNDEVYAVINFADGTFVMQKYGPSSLGYGFQWEKRCCGSHTYRVGAIIKPASGAYVMTVGQYNNDKLSFALVNTDSEHGNWQSSINPDTYSFFVTNLDGEMVEADINFQMSLAVDDNFFACSIDPQNMTPQLLQFYPDNTGSISVINSWALKTRPLQYDKQMCHTLYVNQYKVVALFQEFEHTQELGAMILDRYGGNYIRWYKISTHSNYPRQFQIDAKQISWDFKLYTYGSFTTQLDCVAQQLLPSQSLGMLNMPLGQTCLSAAVADYMAYFNDAANILQDFNLLVTQESDTYTSETDESLTEVTNTPGWITFQDSGTGTPINLNRTCQTLEQATYSDLMFLPKEGTQVFNLPRTRPRVETLDYGCYIDMNYNVFIEDNDDLTYDINGIDYADIILSVNFGPNARKTSYKIKLSYGNNYGFQTASYAVPDFYLKVDCGFAGNLQKEYDYVIGEQELAVSMFDIFPSNNFCPIGYNVYAIDPPDLFYYMSELFSCNYGEGLITVFGNQPWFIRTYTMGLYGVHTGGYHTWEIYGIAEIKVHVKDTPPPIFPALLNIGGPVFTSEIESQISIVAGKQLIKDFPSIVDPDNDNYECTVSLGSASPFVTYDSMKLMLKPLSQHVSVNPYTVKITLKDLNAAESKSNQYLISILVTNATTSSESTNQTEAQSTSSNSSESVSSYVFTGKMENVKESSASMKGSNEIVVTKVQASLKLIEVTNDGRAKVKIIGQFKEQIFQAFTNSSFKIIVSTREVNQNVNYSIEGLSSNILTLKLSFKNPMSLSNSQTFDMLQIRTNRQISINSIYTIETLKKGIMLESYIPTQMTAEQAAQLQKIQKSSEYASYALVSSNLVLNVFLSGILSYLFGLLNDISQIIMLSLININIPGQAQLIMNMLMNLIYMDLLQTDLWLEKLMNIEDDDQALCPSFKQAGYSSHNTVSNLGSTFVFIIVLIALYLIFALLSLLSKYKPQLLDTVKKWNDKAFWNLPVRFFIQQFQAVIISSFLNIALEMNKFKITTEEFKESIDSYGQSIGVFLGLLLLCCTIISPLLMIRVIYKHRKDLESSVFTKKYGTILEGLRLSTNSLRSSIIPYFNILVLFRWGIQITLLVFLYEHPSLQIISLLALSLAFTIMVLLFQPYQSFPGYFKINENDFKVFNEMMVSYYLFAMMLLTDFNSDDDIRSSAGVCELSIICLSVFCNILKAALIGVNELIRKRELKKNKVQKFVKDTDPQQKFHDIFNIKEEQIQVSEINSQRQVSTFRRMLKLASGKIQKYQESSNADTGSQKQAQQELQMRKGPISFNLPSILEHTPDPTMQPEEEHDTMWNQMPHASKLEARKARLAQREFFYMFEISHQQQ